MGRVTLEVVRPLQPERGLAASSPEVIAVFVESIHPRWLYVIL